MKSILFLLFTLLVITSFAQQPVTWKGGTPGRETAWHEPRNWGNYRVPDESSHILIQALHTGHHAQPIIKDEVEVASITICTGATLTIENGGELTIDGSYQYTLGIVNQGGQLINEGIISLYQLAEEAPELTLTKMRGAGAIWVDEVQIDSNIFFRESRLVFKYRAFL